MAAKTTLAIEDIHKAYESIRGDIAVEAFYAVVAGFMVLTFVHRIYTAIREVQSNQDGVPTAKDYMNLVWQCMFCVLAAGLMPVLLKTLENVFGILMDDLQTGLGGQSYRVAELFQKPISAEFEKQVGQGFETVLLNPVGKALDYVLMYLVGAICAPLYLYSQTLFICGRYMFLLLLELISPVAIACFYNEGTRTYFYQWCKNLLVCYLMVPAFILASRFSDAIVCELVMQTIWAVSLQIIFSLMLKFYLLKTVTGKIQNLF